MPNLLALFSRSRNVSAATPAPVRAPTPVPASGDALPATLTPATVVDAIAPTTVDETPALDCLGGILQCWSRHPILLPDETHADAARTIGEWQRHATLGTPIPGVHAPDAAAGPVQSRDWTTLTTLTSERRRAEAANVGQHLGDLQRVVWDTVTSLARVAGDDTITNTAVEQELALLRASAQRGDPAAVMRELPAALQAITGVLAARQVRALRERSEMAERVETLGRALSSAEDSARTDPLTGAGNRLRFTETTERALAMMALSGSPASMITIDIDGLKVLNDTFGHGAGDIAITAVAKACWTVCTRPTDALCRLGGDEFAMVMTNTSATSAAALADRLERRLNDSPVLLAEGLSRVVMASIGVAAAQPGDTPETWTARGDKRLYEAKRTRTV